MGFYALRLFREMKKEIEEKTNQQSALGSQLSG